MDINKLERKHLLIISIIVLVISIPVVYAGVTFDIERKNLSQSSNNERTPEITTADNSVYVVWFNDTSNKLQFVNSTDNGTSFDSPIDLGNLASSGIAANPQIVVKDGASESQNKLYVVWVDGTDIKIINSTDNGNSFFPEIDIGDTGGSLGGYPKITNSSSDKVYVTWLEDNSGSSEYTVKFITSTSSGNFSNAEIDLDTGIVDDTLPAPAIAADGTNVYVVWAGNSGVMKLRNSTNSGTSFGSTITIGSHGGDFVHANPDITVNGTKVYLAWRNSGNINFINSTNSGSFPDSAISLGSAKSGDGSEKVGPVIAFGSGGNVYVVWQDNTNQIQFIRSTNSGDSFETAQVLDSGTSILSTDPQIATAGDSVFVVWQEGNAGNDKDIILRTSGSNGTSFSSEVDLSSNLNSTSLPKLSVLGDKVYVVWEEHPTSSTSANGEIKFSAATVTDTTITFNQTQYRISDAATITIADILSNSTTGVDTINNVNIKSDTDTTGINISFRETGGKTAIFTNSSLTFVSGSGSVSAVNSATDINLNVTAGDTITTTFGGNIGSATIFPIIIGFNATNDSFNQASFTLDQFAFLRVNDGNSNKTTSVETITVTLSSQRAPSDDNNPTTITLTETGGKTGIFGSSSTNSIIFMNNHPAYPLDNSLTISQNNVTNANATAIETITVDISSDTDTSANSVTLTETGVNTGVFEAIITFITGTTSGNSIQASAGDYVKIVYTGDGTLTDRGLITPNSDSSKAALRVSAEDGTNDSVTASFGGFTKSTAILVQSGEKGGGGGGLVRPTITLNAVLSVSSAGGGGGIDFSPPSSTLDKIFNYIEIPEYIQEILNEFDPNIPIAPLENVEIDLPLKINQNSYPLGSDRNTIQTETIKIGEPVRFEMVFYDNSEMIHASMYLNIRDNQGSHESDTLISYNKYGPLTIIDKNSFFENVNVEATKVGLYKNIIVFEITFAKEMEKSDLIYKSWDIRKFATQVIVYDAIQISAVNDVIMDPEPTIDDVIMDPEPGVDDIKKVLDIPEWIKNSIEIWSEDKINDDSFIQGIQFLVQEQIIDIPMESNVSEVKDKNIRIFEEEKITRVPDWVKDNAGWWVEGLLSDEEFINSIKFLLEKETIMI